MIEKKEIEPDEEPSRGTLLLKGRVNKDGDYLMMEIRKESRKGRSKQAGDERIFLLQSQLDDARRERQEKELLIQNGVFGGHSSSKEQCDEEGRTTVVGCDQGMMRRIGRNMQKRGNC
ncbi:hypothetical protein Tco_0900334 [Tanacetum coccineum]